MTPHERAPRTVGDGEPTDDVAIAAPRVGEAERARVDDVLASGRLAAADEVAAFEDAFAGYCGVDRAAATANGAAALQAALTALGVGEGDRVVTTPLSFVATANAVRLAGAEPAFADVDRIAGVVREATEVTA